MKAIKVGRLTRALYKINLCYIIWILLYLSSLPQIGRLRRCINEYDQAIYYGNRLFFYMRKLDKILFT